MILFFIFIFVVALIILFNFKVEKSQIIQLNVDKQGGASFVVQPKTLILLKRAKEIYVNINDKQYLVHINEIINRDNSYLITLDGMMDVLPGEKINVTIIYGYESLINSLISSGV